MKAIRVEPDGGVGLRDVPDPVAGPGEVIVNVRWAGLCATDRKLVGRGADPPRVPGHEAAGLLDDGTEVVVHPDTGCGMCRWCRQGQQNRCSVRTAIGLDRDGGLAERVAVPRAHVVATNGLPPSLAAMLEPLACCVHAVGQLGIEPGEPVQVVGAGAMGILAMWTLQAAGARVLVSQRGKERRNLAVRLGADAVCSPDDDPADVLEARPRAVLISAPSSDAVAAAVAQVEAGGRIHAFAGIPDGAPVDVNDVHYRHLTIVGSTGSGTRDLQAARDLVLDGSVPLTQLPTERITLVDAPEALQRPPAAPALKTVVDVARGAA